MEFEGKGFAEEDDTRFLSAARELLKEIKESEETAAENAMPVARTGVEQWRYLLSLGRGEPKVLDRNYVFGDGSDRLVEEVKVVFPDQPKPEVIKFDLGPALGYLVLAQPPRISLVSCRQTNDDYRSSCGSSLSFSARFFFSVAHSVPALHRWPNRSPSASFCSNIATSTLPVPETW